MVDPALETAIDAMSVDERWELVDYIERTVFPGRIEIDDAQREAVQSRAADLEADPSIGLTWDEMKVRLASRRA